MPAIFVSEKGGMLYGKQAWQFIFKNYQLYPRAEIFGLQSDGKKVQYFLRELDFADHPRVFAYENEQKIMPSFQLDGFYPSKEVQPPSLLKTLLPITAPKAP
ncbi:MAG: hypothetical protein CUN55_19245 [Phototrophicales bacterium]|nr:MAG: hypothetical protein CUN55_19245 [Phototrophicales bacterium]